MSAIGLWLNLGVAVLLFGVAHARVLVGRGR
jgi:hypothetical protein